MEMDRILGAVCALVSMLSLWLAFDTESWPLGLWGVILGVWTWSGLTKIEVGWRGQLLLLGTRQAYFFGEGWRWAPLPFAVKEADCREVIQKLDAVKAFTADSVEVQVEGSLVYKIQDLETYFGVGSGLKEGLDDIWDEEIRDQIVAHKLEGDPLTGDVGVLKMHVELARKAQAAFQPTSSLPAGSPASPSPTERFGVKVVKVVVAAIAPTDKKVSEDLALKKREQSQKEGQRVEAENIASLMAFFQSFEGGGLDKALAYETALFVIGKADPKKVFSLDPATAAAIAAFLRGGRL